MVQKIIVALAALLLVGCSADQGDETKKSKTPIQAEIVAQALSQENSTSGSGSENLQAGRAGHQLIFFIDPNGGPCRMQDQILKDLAGDITNRVDLRYVQTTVDADRDIFYQYGIRALPTLVLADAAGKEVSRLTPGVQNADDILRLVNTTPGS